VKSPILVVATLLAGAALATLAADPPKDAPKKELTPQQQRMSDCSKASKGMKGAEHQKFMSDCLKKDSTIDVGGGAKHEPKPMDPKTAQQEKMKTCNADASKQKLKGEPRSKFMSECLKGSAAGETPKEPKPEPMAKKPTQQEKMKSCNASADKDKLKGEARSKFMSECLKGAA
jgi:psiF repeat-containing protein